MIGPDNYPRAKARDAGGRKRSHISNDGGGPRVGNRRTCENTKVNGLPQIDRSDSS